jgi:uncharacterized SAM-dependent methyltransferase
LLVDFGNVRIIDMGPGSRDAVRDKLFPVISAFGKSAKEYIAVDVSEKSLLGAKEEVAVAFPHVQANVIHADFVQDNFRFGKSIPVELATLFGLTLCNLPVDPLVAGLPEKMLTASLSRIRTHFASASRNFVITQDANQDLESLRRAYMAQKELYLTLPHLMLRDLPIKGKFNPDGFDVDVEFIPSTQACAVSFIAKEAMQFSIKDENFQVKRGQRLYFHNAFKFDVATFTRCIRNAGFDVLETVVQAKNPCVLHVLKARPA